MKKGNNEGSIRKRSNGTWEARYSDGRDENGRQIQRSVYGKTRKEVCEKLNTILHNKQMGIYVTPSQTLLKDWLVQWLSSYSSICTDLDLQYFLILQQVSESVNCVLYAGLM